MLRIRKMTRLGLKCCIAACIFYFVVIAMMGVNGVWDYYFGSVRVLVNPALFMLGISFFGFYTFMVTAVMYSCLGDLKRMNQRKRWHGHD